MPSTVRFYLTISSIQVGKVRVGKFPRAERWSVPPGGLPRPLICQNAGQPHSALSQSQVLQLVTLTSNKGNIYLSHLPIFSKLTEEGGVPPRGCSQGYSMTTLATGSCTPQNTTH